MRRRSRPPRSLADAITTIRTELSDAVCAQVVGRSKSLILKWGDPDHPSLPNIAQACALDRAFIAAGHGDPPIAMLYRHLMQDALSPECHDAEKVETAGLSMQATAGDLTVAIGEAVRSHWNGRSVIGPRDRAAIREIPGRLDDGAEATEHARDQGDEKNGS